MKVKRGRLEFNNVIGYRVECSPKDWVKQMAILKAAIIKNNVCVTGPFIIKGNLNRDISDVEEAIFYLPIHRKVELSGNNTQFFFVEKLCVEDTLKVRHTELEDSIQATEIFLEAVASNQNLKIKKPFYYVYLPVFQEYVVDIWAEIEKE